MRIYNSYRAIDKQCRSHASVILSKSPCQKMSSNDHPLDCSSFVSSGRLMCTIFDTTSYWELSITTLFVRLYTSIFTKLSHDFVHWHRTLSPGLFSYSPSHAFYPMKPKPVHSGPLARNYTTTVLRPTIHECDTDFGVYNGRTNISHRFWINWSLGASDTGEARREVR